MTTTLEMTGGVMSLSRDLLRARLQFIHRVSKLYLRDKILVIDRRQQLQLLHTAHDVGNDPVAMTRDRRRNDVIKRHATVMRIDMVVLVEIVCIDRLAKDRSQHH